MRRNALRARPRRRGKPRDDGERLVIADNILDWDFQGYRPNQKWLADFAARTFGSHTSGLPRAGLYVAVVLDLFSRRAVGWSMKADRDALLVMDALMMGSGDAARPMRFSIIRTRGRNIPASSFKGFLTTMASPAR